MNIKKVVLSIVVTCLLVSPIESYSLLWNNFKVGSEPDGFRDIKWGQNISTIKDMIFIKDTFQNDDSIKEYKRNSDSLRIGTAQLKNMRYHFRNGKFYFAHAELEGSNNWKTIKNVCFKMFGERKINITEYKGTRKDGSRYEERIEDYTWEG